jgi:hypothetical protein
MSSKEIAALLRLAADVLEGANAAPAKETRSEKVARETRERLQKQKIKRLVKTSK